jgi:hypothetical protein
MTYRPDRRGNDQNENEIENGRWLKLSDAARALEVSEITLRRRIKSDAIPCEFRNGKYYVFVSPDSFLPEEPPSRRTMNNSPNNLTNSLPSRNDRMRHFERPYERPSQRQNESSNERHFEKFNERPNEKSQMDRALADRVDPKMTRLEHEVRDLRRMLEDQQTLIAMLEEAIETLSSTGHSLGKNDAESNSKRFFRGP